MALTHVPDPRFLIAETDTWAVCLNTDQNLLGRCYLLLKRPETDPLALAAPELAELWALARRVRQALNAAWEPDHYNFAFLMNIDRQTHFHIIPRYRLKREFEGGTFVDPEFGGHYGTGPSRILDDPTYEAVITEIRRRL